MNRIAWLVSLLVVGIVGCTEEDGVRHLPDARVAADAAVDGPGDVAVHVTLAGNGSGTVTSSPDGISCGSACSADFAPDTMVTLTAAPSAGSVFGGWSGKCSGSETTCTVKVDEAESITATFTLAKHTVTVTKAGAGSGTVSGGALACGATCTITVDHGTSLSLSAAPASLSVFAGWGGACSGTGTCDVTINGDTTISANFALDDFTLFVSRTGNGTGTVMSSPGGINCGTDCDQTYSANQMVMLSASPGLGSVFGGWSGGGCTGTGTCTVTMTAAKTVTATFTLTTHTLTVARAGTGSGSVMGTGITCGTDCSETFDYGTPVTLTAATIGDSTFTGWSGACTGTGTCTVTMDAAKSVTATFTLNTYALTVARAGTGAGSVTGPGITCGTDCTEIYNSGATVSLTAATIGDSTFTGWSGACTGTGACNVTMSAAKDVTATFTLNTYALSVTKAGTGTGTVMGPGITCGTDCTEIYNSGATVSLTAAPIGDATFTGWSGACTGTGACNVTMSAAKGVTATFTLNTYALTVTKAGTGSGTVNGPGITCGTDCTETFNSGVPVSLTASASAGSTFTGWSGACSGTGGCSVTMDNIKGVTATFVLDVTLSVVTSGAGTVTGTGITCGTDCSETVAPGTPITLTATPSTDDATASTFAGWSGACTGTSTTCTVTVNNTTSVTATFVLKPNVIFVTNTLFTGSLGGLSGADQKCNDAAHAVNLRGTYVAYLSSINGNTFINAPDRVGGATGWVRPDGRPVMHSITQMTAGTLTYAPQITETGVDVANTQIPYVWTGTSMQGTYHSACSASLAFIPWGGSSGAAMMGLATSTAYQSVQLDTYNCAQAIHLYCLGIDRAASVP